MLKQNARFGKAGRFRLALSFVILTGIGLTCIDGQQSKRVDSGSEAKDEIIGPSDTLTIVLLDSEELSKTWRVGATGDLNLPMVGRIHAAGMTVEQFESDLSHKLRKYFKDPQLTVFVSEFRSQPVTVTGAVEKPGTVQLEGTRTLFEVMMRAGGPKVSASEVTLTRALERGAVPWPSAKEDANGYSVAKFPVKDVMDGRSGSANIRVEPYDVVSVQDGNPQRLVHIIGDVNKPGAVELLTQDSVSLVRVIAVAGGFTRAATPTKARILHIGRDGASGEPAIINLKMIMEGKARDLELTAGDVVIVPGGQLLKSSIQSLAMTAATASVYVLATL